MKFYESGVFVRTLLCCAFVLSLNSAGQADSFEVTRDADDMGGGTLREAIAAANGTTGDDLITFAASLNNSEIVLDGGTIGVGDTTGKITIDASSLPDGIRISGSSLERARVFEVNLLAELELVNLIISGGRAPHGENGVDGASADQGDPGGAGGAIFNEGILTLDRCELYSNSAGNGGNGGEFDSDTGAAGAGGAGGDGGAIYSDGNNAEVTLIDTLLEFNFAGDGGVGGGVASGRTATPAVGGKGGNGGGLYCARGKLTVMRTSFLGNEAGAGGTGGYDGDGGTGRFGGAGGDGGAIAAVQAYFEIEESELEGNYAGNGGEGGAVSMDIPGPGGDGGNGGGIYVEATDVTSISPSFGNPSITRSLLFANRAGDGAKGGSAMGLPSGDGTYGGDGGLGGGVFLTTEASGSSAVGIENSTFTNNYAGRGGRGGAESDTGSEGDGGYGGSGGGLALQNSIYSLPVVMSHCTVVANGSGTPGIGGSPEIEGTGGGIWTGALSGVTLANSVVTLNDSDPPTNVGPFASDGNNFTSGDPVLGPFQDNGGSTRTLMPQALSPLIDGGATISNPLLTDQRGESRPKNGAPDLGAVEVGIQVDAKIGKKSNPAAQKVDNFYSASGAGQVLRVKLSGRRKSKFHFSLQNDGAIEDQLILSGPRANKTLKLKTFRLTGGRVNVTGAMRSGYSLGAVAPGGTVVFQVQAKARSSKRRARQNLTFQGRSVSASSVDGVKAKVKQSKR